MAIQVKKSEGFSSKLFTGFFTGKVIAINPTKEEHAALLGYELKENAEEIKYSGETEQGKSYVDINFIMEANTPEKQKMSARFRITDTDSVSTRSGKTQYVNQLGDQSWNLKEEDLADFFTNFQTKEKKNVGEKIHRVAMQGEATFYNFFKAFLAKGDFYSPETNILVDKKRLFRNVDKFVNEEYRPLLDATGDKSLVDSVMALAIVQIKEKDGKVNQYQKLYPSFMPGYMMKKMSLAISSANFMADNKIKKFYEYLTGENGCKDAYTLTLLQPYNPEAHAQASTSTFIQEGEVATDTGFDE
jgi:hypothetical protein